MLLAGGGFLLLRLLACLQGRDLLAQLQEAGVVLLLDLHADIVQSHEGICFVNVIFELLGHSFSTVSRGDRLTGWLPWCDFWLLTSARGVPGMEPWVEFVRLMGGVRIRRPNLSNLAGEAVREMMDDAEPMRWWCRWPGRTGALSAGSLEDSAAEAGVDVGGSDLLALTRATAACASC